MSNIYAVKFSKRAQNDLKKLPLHLFLKLESWIHSVGLCGLYEVKKIKGYHDELLKGKRAGQHSIRLNKAYRAIYYINKNQIAEIIEVTKHEY